MSALRAVHQDRCLGEDHGKKGEGGAFNWVIASLAYAHACHPTVPLWTTGGRPETKSIYLIERNVCQSLGSQVG